MKTTLQQAAILATRQAIALVMVLGITALLAACGSSPAKIEDLQGGWLERAQVQSQNNVTITASVPSADETKEIFGTNLYKKDVQPLWLKIENRRDTPVTFLPIGIDPEYYTPIEAANIDVNLSINYELNPIVNKQYFDSSLKLVIDAGQTVSGFIFTRLDEGTKAFNIDVSDGETFFTYTFFIPVPGLNIDHYDVDWSGIYSDEEVQAFDSHEPLVEALENFACCVTDKSGKNTGDPLNLVVIGYPRDVYYSFIRANWDETETVDRRSAIKTVKSFLGGSEYRYSPVSSLYVFDRAQDVAFQKARDNIHERNHLRLWLAPATYQGLPVWLGQISRDIGVRFTKKTITTHKIDPDVDETRESLLENLVYHQALHKFAYVKGVGEVSIDNPQGNLTGDPWFTDGHRLVLWLISQPVALDGIEFIHWRPPPLRQNSPQKAADH